MYIKVVRNMSLSPHRSQSRGEMQGKGGIWTHAVVWECQLVLACVAARLDAVIYDDFHINPEMGFEMHS